MPNENWRSRCFLQNLIICRVLFDYSKKSRIFAPENNKSNYGSYCFQSIADTSASNVRPG